MVIVSVPVDNIDVVMLATPLVSVAVPSDVEPFMNWTVPVGVPEPGLIGTTVAVSITGCPKTGELGVVERVAVVDA